MVARKNSFDIVPKNVVFNGGMYGQPELMTVIDHALALGLKEQRDSQGSRFENLGQIENQDLILVVVSIELQRYDDRMGVYSMHKRTLKSIQSCIVHLCPPRKNKKTVRVYLHHYVSLSLAHTPSIQWPSCLPNPRPCFPIALACSALILAKRASSFASRSTLLICSLASLTATFAWASARSASRSAASARVTRSRAATMDGSS